MQSLFKRAGLALLSLLACGAFHGAQARDIYVSPAGNDAQVLIDSTGTENAPYKTLAKVATLVQPGDVVLIKEGVYAPFTLTVSGTEAQWITWKAAPGAKPEVKIQTASQLDAIVVRASYQVIDGLTVTGFNDDPSITLDLAQANVPAGASNPVALAAFNTRGIMLDNSGKADSLRNHHLVVRNSVLRSFGCSGIAITQADYITLERNALHDNAWYSRNSGCSGVTFSTYSLGSTADSLGYRNIIRGNRFWNNRSLVIKGNPAQFRDGHGLFMWGAQRNPAAYPGRTLITNNIAAYNGGSGINFFQGDSADVVHNTVYWNADKVGTLADVHPTDSRGLYINNNIIVARSTGRPTWTHGLNQNVLWDTNLLHGAAPPAPVSGQPASTLNAVVGDPLLLNISGDMNFADFRLQGASPAIDRGLASIPATVLPDIVDTYRPTGLKSDLGAYEFNIAPKITSQALVSAPVNGLFSFALKSVDNGAARFEVVGALPAGLVLNPSTGVISGVPTVTGTRRVTIVAINNLGRSNFTLTISVNTTPASGSQPPPPKLVIRNGFEGSTTITPRRASHYNLTGNDGAASYPSDWAAHLGGSTPYFSTGQLFLESGTSADRDATIDKDPLNENNKVMKFSVAKKHIFIFNSDGSLKEEKARIQHEFENKNAPPPGGFIREYYQKVRLYFSPDFAVLEQAPTDNIGWIVMQEYWNDPIWNSPNADGTFRPRKQARTGIEIKKKNGRLHFGAMGRDPELENPSPYNNSWEVNNWDFKIPLGKWMTQEIYVKEGGSAGTANPGRFYMSIEVDGVKTVIVDKIGMTTSEEPGYVPDGQTSWMGMKFYTEGKVIDWFTTKGKKAEVLWDDFEVWIHRKPETVVP